MSNYRKSIALSLLSLVSTYMGSANAASNAPVSPDTVSFSPSSESMQNLLQFLRSIADDAVRDSVLASDDTPAEYKDLIRLVEDDHLATLGQQILALKSAGDYSGARARSTEVSRYIEMNYAKASQLFATLGEDEKIMTMAVALAVAVVEFVVVGDFVALVHSEVSVTGDSGN